MKNSAFDLAPQNLSIESKIVPSLERVSQAFKVLLWNESKEFSLSPIQVQVLIFLLHHSAEKRKVSYLANEFNMTKATISDAIKTLEEKLLIAKEYEKADTRSYVIHLTKKGKDLAKQIQVPIDKSQPVEKENLLLSLLEIIHHLNKSGVITIQRMCFTCNFYKANKNGKEHFCNLLNTKLANSVLRIDCAEYQIKQTA